MVFKEQLCDWFGKLNSYRRIEYICALLHLCLPIELRFIGSVLEDLGKRDFLFLRDAETRANNITIVGKLTSLPEILVSLTLLHSSNARCANLLYHVLQSYLQRCFNKILSRELDDENNSFAELMTMLTVAVNHPAFNFEQKQSLSEFYLRALDYSLKIEERQLSLDVESPHIRFPAQQQFNTVSITGMELKDARRNANNVLDLNIQVKFSDGIVIDLWKTPQDIYTLHNKLISLYSSQEGKIPFLKTVNIQKEDKIIFSNYIRKLSRVPKHVLDSGAMMEFFRGEEFNNKLVYQTNLSPKSTYYPSSSPSNLSADEENAIPPFQTKTLTFQNSQFPVCQPVQRHYNVIPQVPLPTNRQFAVPAQNDSPSHSPLSSSTDSTHNSPSASPLSQTTDMTSVTQLLKLIKMEEYSDKLNKFTVQQLISMSDEDLVKTDLSKDAQDKLKIKLEYFRKPNGLIEPPMITNVSPMVATWPQFPVRPQIYFAANPLPTTRDSSPSNSETSSPPVSPHVIMSANVRTDDKNQREDKETTPTGSLPRSGKTQNNKYTVHNYRPMDGPLPPGPHHAHSHPPPPLHLSNFHDTSQDVPAIPNQNGFPPDNNLPMSSNIRPEMMKNFVRPYPAKMVQHPNMNFSNHVMMMSSDKSGTPMAPYIITPVPGMRNDFQMQTSVLPVDGQNRQFINQPGILGQPPPNNGHTRHGFTNVTNSSTMTNAVGPNTSLTPTPPMSVNTGTKSPSGVQTLVNSSSDTNLQTHEQTNSPSPLQMNNPAITTVPCTSGGPVIHHNHLPCSTCGSPRPPQPGFQFPAGYLPTSNGFMQTIPSMPQPYPHHMHPHIFPNGMNPEVLNSMPHPMFHPVQHFMGFYGNNMFSGMTNVANKKTNCYNCGSSHHSASECKEATMESTSGHYHLNFKVKTDSD